MQRHHRHHRHHHLCHQLQSLGSCCECPADTATMNQVEPMIQCGVNGPNPIRADKAENLWPFRHPVAFKNSHHPSLRCFVSCLIRHVPSVAKESSWMRPPLHSTTAASHLWYFVIVIFILPPLPDATADTPGGTCASVKEGNETSILVVVFRSVHD